MNPHIKNIQIIPTRQYHKEDIKDTNEKHYLDFV